MSDSPIRLAFYLPSLRAYRDRAHLVDYIARKTEKTFLLVSRLDADPRDIGLEHLDLVEVPRGRRILGRLRSPTMFAASRVMTRLIREQGVNVVHDTFGQLLPLYRRRGRYPSCVFLTSLYLLAEWDFRHVMWPQYRFGLLWRNVVIGIEKRPIIGPEGRGGDTLFVVEQISMREIHGPGVAR